jgi:hypothetical protein
MSALDKLKSKIKQVNIPGRLNQIINEAGANPANPYLQE